MKPHHFLTSRFWYVLVFLFSTGHSLDAQTAFEGIVTSQVTVLETPPDMRGMEDMLNHTIVTHVKGTRTRVEQVTAAGNSVIITNSEKREVVMLMEMMGQKIAMVMPMEGNARTPGTAFEYNGEEIRLTNEKKKIVGHNCQKGFLTIEGVNMEVWFATGLRHSELVDDRLPGMAMEYTVSDNGLKMRFQVTKVEEDEVSEKMFVIPSEYQIKSSASMEEFMPYIFGEPEED